VRGVYVVEQGLRCITDADIGRPMMSVTEGEHVGYTERSLRRHRELASLSVECVSSGKELHTYMVCDGGAVCQQQREIGPIVPDCWDRNFCDFMLGLCARSLSYERLVGS
jgi:hypothetical protein